MRRRAADVAGTEGRSSGVPAPSDRPSSRSLSRAVAVCAAGTLGPTLAVAAEGPTQRQGAAVLLAIAAATVILLMFRISRNWWGFLPLVTFVALCLLLPAPSIGRTPVLIVIGLTCVAFTVLIEWRPAGRFPGRSTASALVAVPMLVASNLIWGVAQAWVAMGAVLGVTVLIVEGYHRRNSRLLQIDAAIRSVLEPVRTMLVDWIRTAQRERTRSSMVVIAVALMLRLAWVIAMTRSDSGPLPIVGDWYSTWNLRMAAQFAAGQTPSLGGVHTAFWAPGLALVLAPVAWFSRVSGLFSINFAASLVNVVLGTLSVVMVGGLAKRWIGPSAKLPAMWLMALAPGQIFATSVAVPETLTAALFLGVALAATVVAERAGGVSVAKQLLGIGVLVGFAVLVVDRAAFLLFVPAVAIRALSTSWSGTIRATGLVALGAIAVLAPWTVRNGVQVGWWSPTATSVTEGMCSSKYDIDRESFTGTGSDVLLEAAEDCARNSPLDDARYGLQQIAPPGFEFDHPDEAAFARRNSSLAIRWFVSNPLTLAQRIPTRVRDVVADDSNGGLDIANHFDLTPVAGPETVNALKVLGNAWYYLVASLAIVGLWTMRRLRRAAPLWLIPIAVALQPVLGPYGFSRHFFPAHPFLAVLAAGSLAALGAGSKLIDERSTRETPSL